MKKITIGILAHVDSGKTTLSEAILYQTGLLRTLGRVDHGNAFMDSHEIEQDRGITIFSNQAVFAMQQTEVTLLDTPGHVDFSAEMERTLQVLDYAILVISGTDGVQSHTETLWQLLIRYGIPVFLFVNKMDISHKSQEELMQELKDKLDTCCIDFRKENREKAEELAMCNETLMEQFLSDGTISEHSLCEAIQNRQVFPVFFGSALKSSGIEELLDGLHQFTLQPSYGTEFGAKVFKITQDAQGERLTHLKITGGSLQVKEMVSGKNKSEKVNQIRLYSGAKYELLSEATAGTVCSVTGLTFPLPGEGLGAEPDSDASALEPILNYRVELPQGTDAHTALSKFRLLEEEDPQLHILWQEALQEIHFRIMGEVQLEVLKRVILQRFGMEVGFSYSSIAYKETLKEAVIGVGHYEPLRHYAEVHLLLEPLKTGSGLVFGTKCSEDELERNWQRLILTHLQEKEHIGVLTGSPITDMKITLVAGRAHRKHTVGGDFRQATYRALRQGLRCGESVLLEPVVQFKLEVPSDCIGRAISDVQQMGGQFEPPETRGETALLSGTVPAVSIRGYQQELIGYTKGRGRISYLFSGYEPCHNTEQVMDQMGYIPDSDVENTADSVFCSHGAGFTVKWNEVSDYQHLDSGIRLESEEVKVQKAVGYVNRLASDEELMKIFEMTYGPVKKPTLQTFQTKKERPSEWKPAKQKPQPSGKEYLLIDGYNIIHAWEELRKQAEKNMDLARETLIHRICNYQGFHQCEAIVVFDAYRVEGGLRSVEKVCNIHVVYTKEAETADMYIEKTTHELGKKHRVRVATSDHLEQLIIIGNGAVRIPADAFLAEVEETERQIREFLL
ncbi:MAG: GTP-binding protein [Ruminococcaceae bacterium]|nr:GTP-binding protein [Oscillospiraceae bacterium]